MRPASSVGRLVGHRAILAAREAIVRNVRSRRLATRQVHRRIWERVERAYCGEPEIGQSHSGFAAL